MKEFYLVYYFLKLSRGYLYRSFIRTKNNLMLMPLRMCADKPKPETRYFSECEKNACDCVPEKTKQLQAGRDRSSPDWNCSDLWRLGGRKHSTFSLCRSWLNKPVFFNKKSTYVYIKNKKKLQIWWFLYSYFWSRCKRRSRSISHNGEQNTPWKSCDRAIHTMWEKSYKRPKPNMNAWGHKTASNQNMDWEVRG